MPNHKNIYEFLNETDFNIDEYNKETLTGLEKRRLKKNLSKSKGFGLKRAGIVAAVMLLSVVLLSQTGFGKMVYAEVESRLSELTYSINEALGIERDIAPYASVVNQIAEDKGIAIKLADVIIDKDELILSTLIDMSGQLKTFDSLNDDPCLRTPTADCKIFINGKRAKVLGSTGGIGPVDDSYTLFAEISHHHIEGIDLKETIDIRILFDRVSVYADQGDINFRGKWEFEFRASGAELAKDTYSVALNHSFDLEGRKYILEEFRYNPVSQKIYGTITGSPQKYDDMYDIKLSGADNLGSEVDFYSSTMSPDEFVLLYNHLDKDLSAEIEFITLAPYAVKLPEESGKMSSGYQKVGEEFTIHLKK